MEALEAILTRRSIREYTSQAVPDELIKKLLYAAMQAPSAGNQQPWHFIVVTERNQMNSLADALPFGKMLLHAPLAIVVCADLKAEVCRGYWVQDCSAATQNLLLAARAINLGAALTTIPTWNLIAARRILGLPWTIRKRWIRSL